MQRRDAVLALALGTAPLAASAQRTERMRRIGVLTSVSQNSPASKLDLAGLHEGLQEKGWFEGKNLQADYRWADNDAGRARSQAAELASMAPDLIFSGGTIALNALRDVKVKIPIVFVNITDPVAGGFVTSLARPGGNMTGFTPFEYDIGGKWLQLLRDAVPGIAHATLLGDPANHNFAGFVRSFTAAAKAMNVQPTSAPIRNTSDIGRAIEAEARSPHGGLIVSATSFSIVNSELIVGLANKFRLPAIYWNKAQVDGGGLMSYGPNSSALCRAAADYVDRILKGAKPEDLPVQAPNKTDLTINLKSAKALGITIPQTVLLQANEVIR
jgi:putative ABC transport system substrate-binding protein